MDRRRVLRLVAFARALVPADLQPDVVRIHDGYRASSFVCGQAGGGEVDLYIPEDFGRARYPRRQVYRKAAGALVYRCPCEEVVSTAAHELRHIVQDRLPAFARPKFYEVDAEAAARSALDIYRLRPRCRHG